MILIRFIYNWNIWIPTTELYYISWSETHFFNLTLYLKNQKLRKGFRIQQYPLAHHPLRSWENILESTNTPLAPHPLRNWENTLESSNTPSPPNH